MDEKAKAFWAQEERKRLATSTRNYDKAWWREIRRDCYGHPAFPHYTAEVDRQRAANVLQPV